MSRIEVELMTPAEVRFAFRVDRKTVDRWRTSGKLMSVKTPGGHRRYFRLQVEAIREGRELTSAQVEILRLAGGQP